jgi:hypothetical protein
MYSLIKLFQFQLSMQLMALGAQSPGIWQSQLAAAAVRQMSNNPPGVNIIKRFFGNESRNK